MTDKDTRRILRALEDQGFTITRTKKGHLMIWKDGRSVTTIPGTGSDYRGIRNAIAPLRRAGFVWDPKGERR